jgi:hypothetical protein
MKTTFLKKEENRYEWTFHKIEYSKLTIMGLSLVLGAPMAWLFGAHAASPFGDKFRGSNKSKVTGNVDFKSDKGTTKGFRIGNCPPVPGQIIKVETTDVGTVTFLRTVAPAKGQDQTERLGLPQKYSVDGLLYFQWFVRDWGRKSSKIMTCSRQDGKKTREFKKIIIERKREI